MLKAVIFDMDGVIIDSEPAYQEIEKKMFEFAGLTLSEEEHFEFIGRSEKEMWPILIERHKLSVKADEIVKLVREKIFECIWIPDKIPLVDGIIPLLEELNNHHILLAVASSSNRQYVHAVLEKHDISRFFKVVVTADDVSVTKPAPDIFLKTLDLLNCKSSNTIVIEDSKNGVVASKKAGIKVIAFKNPNTGEQDISSADLIVNSLHELSKEIFEQLTR